jgi:hypothetical protein
MTFSRDALKASAIMNTPLDACTRYAEYMTAAGFENVTEHRLKLPVGPWPKEKRLKLIGAFELHNLLQGLGAMSYRMFSKAYGWSATETEVYLVNVRNDTRNMKYHQYYDL